MKNRYKVIDEFSVKNSKVLVLDRPREIKDYDTLNIIADKKTYPFSIAHNPNWIIIKGDSNFTGKEIVFE